tara:strand:- start:2758 stop:3153 length:396 start_codon:yes stop_codon:yes gene_type:complete
MPHKDPEKRREWARKYREKNREKIKEYQKEYQKTDTYKEGRINKSDKYKIYKIVDNTNDNIYIGITRQKYLSDRLGSHVWDYKTQNKKGCVSRDIIKNGDYKIELIEETLDKSREKYWIENTECINKQIPQ